MRRHRCTLRNHGGLRINRRTYPKACFDLVRAATAVMDADAIPSKNLILSLLSILSLSNGQLPPFRTASYDASLSACLVALYATSHNGTVECTAQALLDILPQTIKHSLSLELKVALCDIYAMIIKHCPWYSEHLTVLLPLAYIPEIVYHVSYCIELGLATIGTDIGAGRTNSSEETDDSSGVKPEGSNVIKEELDLPAVGCPESDAGTKELEDARRKRRKLSDDGTARKDENTHIETTKALEPQEDPSVLGGGCRSIDILMSRPLIEQESRCSAGSVYNELLQMMDTIEPKHNAISGDTSVEGKLAALHVLVKVFTKHPVEVCNQRLIQLFHDWVVWILKKSEEQTLGRTQLFMFLEALDCLLARQPVGQSQVTDCSEVVKCNHLEMFCGNSAYKSSCVMEILKLPWVSTELSQDEVLKIKAVDLASKLVDFTEGEPYHEIAEHALKDDNSHVQVTAVLALPAFSRHSNSSRFQLYCTGLLSSAQQSSVDIREAVAQILGIMACICNLRNSRIASGDESLQSFDGLICPECDDGDTDLRISIPNHQENGTCETIKPTLLVLWQPLLSKLLEEETSDRVQVAFISSMSRLLRHASAEELISTRTFWLKCLDVLPLHEHRTVREAFCGQVHFFFSEHVLQGLLRSDVKTISDSDLELDMLGKLRDAFVEAKNSEITQSLLETVAEIAKAAHGRRQLLFFSLVLLLEKLDHEDVSLRVKSISLIHKIASTGFTAASGSTTLSCTQALVDTIRDDLYEHLVRRLVSRPEMVQEFAVAVMRIELEELLKQMVPVILPQLVLVACDQQHSQLALDTLDDLVILLKTESLAVLLLECTPPPSL